MGRRKKIFIPNDIKDLDEVLLFMATAPKHKRLKMLEAYDALQLYNLCVEKGYSLNGYHPVVGDNKTYLRIENRASAVILKKVYDTDSDYWLTSGRKGGFTRRMNRVSEFIHRKSRELYTTGIDGYYKVSFRSWRDRNLANGQLGVVWATNSQDALIIANQMFGHYSSDYNPERLSTDYVEITFLCPGSELAVISHQTSEVNKDYAKSVKRKMDQIKELQKEIDEIEGRKHAVMQTLADVNSIVLEKLLG